MSKTREISILINPISGSGDKQVVIDAIKSNLRSHIKYDIQFTKHAGHATDLAKQAVEQKKNAVVVVGGDGSLNEVGQSLLNTKTALGILPSGSGNGLARHLKIPMDINKALQKINRFKRSKIDVGTVNDDVFLVTCGVGFDAHVAQKFSEFGKRGFMSYMQVSTNEFMNYQNNTYSITVDGKNYEKDAFLIVVANAGQYGNNAWIAPSASIKDGKLNIGILKKFPATVVPDILLRLFNKKIEQSKYYERLSGQELVIKSANQYHVDGEPKTCTEGLKIGILHKALRVIQ